MPPPFDAHQLEAHAVGRHNAVPVEAKITDLAHSLDATFVYESAAPAALKVAQLWQASTVLATHTALTAQGQIATHPVVLVKHIVGRQLLTAEDAVGLLNVLVLHTDATRVAVCSMDDVVLADVAVCGLREDVSHAPAVTFADVSGRHLVVPLAETAADFGDKDSEGKCHTQGSNVEQGHGGRSEQ